MTLDNLITNLCICSCSIIIQNGINMVKVYNEVVYVLYVSLHVECPDKIQNWIPLQCSVHSYKQRHHNHSSYPAMAVQISLIQLFETVLG